METQRVAARWWNQGGQPGDERHGLEDERSGSVGSRALQAKLDAAVGEPVHSVVGDWRSGDVSGEALQSGPVGRLDVDSGVDLEALGAADAQGLATTWTPATRVARGRPLHEDAPTGPHVRTLHQDQRALRKPRLVVVGLTRTTLEQARDALRHSRHDATEPADCVAIRVDGADDVSIVDNEIRDVWAGGGGAEDPAGSWPAQEGGDASGIVVRDATGVLLLDNQIRDVTGGSGGVAWTGDRPSGGDARGVHVEGCSDVLVQGSAIANVRGGPPTFVPSASGAAGSGGDAFGLWLHDLHGLTVQDARVQGVQGGGFDDSLPSGHCPACVPEPAPAGWGVGLQAAAAPDAWLRHVGVRGVESGTPWGGPNGDAYGVEITVSSGLTLGQFTLVDIGVDSMIGVGVRVGTEGDEEVHLDHGLIAQIGAADTGACVHLDGPGQLALGPVGVEACQLNGSSGGPYLDDLDPLDIGGGGGPFSLGADSGAIDAGVSGPDGIDCGTSPGEPVCQEPVPNGCTLNLGLFGGTEQAASSTVAAGWCTCE